MQEVMEQLQVLHKESNTPDQKQWGPQPYTTKLIVYKVLRPTVDRGEVLYPKGRGNVKKCIHVGTTGTCLKVRHQEYKTEVEQERMCIIYEAQRTLK